MFDIHLAWSPLLLVIGVVGLMIMLVATLMLKFKHQKPIKAKMWLFAVLAVLLVVSAFDVGTPQANLHRERFDAKVSKEVVDKVENVNHNATSAKTMFEDTLTQKKAAIAKELKQ